MVCLAQKYTYKQAESLDFKDLFQRKLKTSHNLKKNTIPLLPRKEPLQIF